MRKIVISGGPHSGKTTLFESLRTTLPQYEYVPEPATAVLSGARKVDDDKKCLSEILESPLLFCTLCMKQSILSEERINKEAALTFLDRSLVDTIAYSRRDRCEELVPMVRLLAERAVYQTVLFCEPVGKIRDRIENVNEAQRTHDLLREAYEEMGINGVPPTAVSTKERVGFVRDTFSI